MSKFYANRLRRDELAAASRRWLGTPFRKRAAVCGAGVDCVNLVLRLWAESGFHPSITLPDHYSLDAGAHAETSQVIAAANQCPQLRLSPLRTFADGPRIGYFFTGDLLVFAPDTQSAHHVGLMLDTVWGIPTGEFIHAWRDTGVVCGELRDPTFSRILVAVYRPLATASEVA